MRRPLLAGTPSIIMQAICEPNVSIHLSRASVLPSSSTIVCPETSLGTPALSTIPNVAKPLPALTSNASA